jgi:hypothetical protein
MLKNPTFSNEYISYCVVVVMCLNDGRDLIFISVTESSEVFLVLLQHIRDGAVGKGSC